MAERKTAEPSERSRSGSPSFWDSDMADAGAVYTRCAAISLSDNGPQLMRNRYDVPETMSKGSLGTRNR